MFNKDLKNPVAVLNIKPYLNEKDPKDFVLVADARPYGIGTPEFIKTVYTWLDTINKEKSGTYKLHPRLYNDGKNIINIWNETDYLKMKKSIITSVKKNGRITTIMSNRMRNLRETDKNELFKEMSEINTECALTMAMSYTADFSVISVEKIIECCKTTKNPRILGFIFSVNLIKMLGLTKENLLDILKSQVTNETNCNNIIYNMLVSNILSLLDILSVIDFNALDVHIKYSLITASINLFDKNKEGLKMLYEKGFVTNKLCNCGRGKYIIDYEGCSYNISLNDNDLKNLKSIGIEFSNKKESKSATSLMIELADKYKYKEIILPFVEKCRANGTISSMNEGLKTKIVNQFVGIMEKLFKGEPSGKDDNNMVYSIYNGLYTINYYAKNYDKGGKIEKLSFDWYQETHLYYNKIQGHFH